MVKLTQLPDLLIHDVITDNFILQIVVLDSINGWNGTEGLDEVVFVVIEVFSNFDRTENDSLFNELA